MSLSRLRIPVLVVAMVLLLATYKFMFAYATFEVEDPRYPIVFRHEDRVRKQITGLSFRVKGDVDGRAVIRVYPCQNTQTPAPTQYLPAVEFRFHGPVDTTFGVDYYASNACIAYKPRNVNRGRVSIGVRLR